MNEIDKLYDKYVDHDKTDFEYEIEFKTTVALQLLEARISELEFWEKGIFTVATKACTIHSLTKRLKPPSPSS